MTERDLPAFPALEPPFLSPFVSSNGGSSSRACAMARSRSEVRVRLISPPLSERGLVRLDSYPQGSNPLVLHELAGAGSLLLVLDEAPHEELGKRLHARTQRRRPLDLTRTTRRAEAVDASKESASDICAGNGGWSSFTIRYSATSGPRRQYGACTHVRSSDRTGCQHSSRRCAGDVEEGRRSAPCQ
jgi:hypothetical protein